MDERRLWLKLTPIAGRNLLPGEHGKQRNCFCTLVLLDENKREIKGEKQRTPTVKGHDPSWSPLKAEMLRVTQSHIASHTPLGLEAAAAAEEYTFGKTMDLRVAKYLVVKCKDKALVDADLGRLLLSLDDLDTSGLERVAWYPLQLLEGRMDTVQGEIQVSSRIVMEPWLWQLWTCAKQMMDEMNIKDQCYYLKLHKNCFTGRDAVEWMLRHGPNRKTMGNLSISTEEEALLLADSMMRHNIIYHVSNDSKNYINSVRQLYRFAPNHPDSTIRLTSQEEMTKAIVNGQEKDTIKPKPPCSSSSTGPPLPPVRLTNVSEADSDLSSTPELLSELGSTTSRESLLSDLKIQDFELLRVLGTGSFGRVLSARGPDGCVYAVKIVSKIGMNDMQRRNAKRERDVMRELQHPFVANLSFAFQNEDKLYMGMEFFNGGDLRYHLGLHTRGELILNHERIVFYASELVAGIAHIHSLGILYRDLKPENVLLAGDGHIRIVDFGLSKNEGRDGDGSTTLAGSPDYVAPEVLLASGKKKSSGGGSSASTTSSSDRSSSVLGYDKGCDWWSLGILIFEMYVGRTPFKDANTSIMYRNIVEGDLFLPPDLPQEVKSLLRGLIERDATQRLGASEAVPFSIMTHDYFAGIDWEALQRKELTPPWLPDVISESDAKYIDDEFASQQPMDTPEWRMLDSVDREREHFDDFTYVPKQNNFK